MQATCALLEVETDPAGGVRALITKALVERQGRSAEGKERRGRGHRWRSSRAGRSRKTRRADAVGEQPRRPVKEDARRLVEDEAPRLIQTRHEGRLRGPPSVRIRPGRCCCHGLMGMGEGCRWCRGGPSLPPSGGEGPPSVAVGVWDDGRCRSWREQHVAAIGIGLVGGRQLRPAASNK